MKEINRTKRRYEILKILILLITLLITICFGYVIDTHKIDVLNIMILFVIIGFSLFILFDILSSRYSHYVCNTSISINSNVNNLIKKIEEYINETYEFQKRINEKKYLCISKKKQRNTIYKKLILYTIKELNEEIIKDIEKEMQTVANKNRRNLKKYIRLSIIIITDKEVSIETQRKLNSCDIASSGIRRTIWDVCIPIIISKKEKQIYVSGYEYNYDAAIYKTKKQKIAYSIEEYLDIYRKNR